ncbi:MAG: methyltransferase domain-containing protein [Patescibacteria group bacterium]
MSNLTDQELIKLLTISKTDRVLDVGGSSKQHNQIKVDTLVDIIPPENDPYRPSKNKAKKFVALDITRKTLPFKDKEFDVCLCTHTLEDIYNPFLVIDEMSRVAKRGYISTPSRGKDMEFSHLNLTDWLTGFRRQPGFSHHHWFFEKRRDTMHIVEKNYPLLYTSKFQITKWTGEDEFRFLWKGNIKYSVFESTSFHELIKEYKDFMSRNSQFIKKGLTVIYLDNPYYYIKETIKFLLKRGNGFKLLSK